MTRRPKKSEVLEVRLSHDVKIALRDRASALGKTVSDVVRTLITEELSGPVPASVTYRYRSRLMFFLTRPLTLCLALTGGLVGTLAISSEASAENALILMKSVHVDPNTEEWTSVRRVFVRDPGYSSCLYLEETPHSCNLEQIRPDLLAAKLQVSQASPPVVHVEIMRDNTLIEKSELAPTKTSDDIYEYQSADGFTVTFGVKINTDAALRNPIRLDKLESLPGAFLTAKTTP